MIRPRSIDDKMSDRSGIFGKAVRDSSGATAVEFALIGPVFIALIFSAIEMGLLLTKKALLENAASSISRDIYTGAAAGGGLTQAELQETVCDTLSLLDSTCEDNLAIELTPIANFQAIPTSEVPCIDSGASINPVVGFNPGAGNSIVYMRICLSTNVYTPGIGLGLELPRTPTGKFEVVSALAFANEPF